MSISKFPHPWWYPFSGTGPQPKSTIEWTIIEISKIIRSKPQWFAKYKNQDIVDKWQRELLQQIDSDVKIEIFEYVIKELSWYDKLRLSLDDNFKIECDDKIISGMEDDQFLRRKLILEVNEYKKTIIKDYHPGSSNQVLDIVHPSLFPLQYGKSPILDKESSTNGYKIIKYDESISKFKSGISDWGVSKKFQWIPSLMTLDDNGRYNFNSYINNLHPKNQSLYNIIEDVFNVSIPGLNHVLSRYASPELLRVPYASYGEAYTEEYNIKYRELEDEMDRLEDETGDRHWHLLEEFENSKSQYLKKLIPKYTQDPETFTINLLKDFPNLKVIVKLADIELTPSKPSYPGGTWHVEGTINEDIVATVLYYYEIDNITESKLSFRSSFEDPPYDQGDEAYCETVFGLKDEDKMIKNIGSVKAEQGKFIIFPNCFQHHVDPFELKDKSKPGFRRILCFFIVDPYNELVKTTKDIPPQQKSWWDDDKENELVPESIKKNEEPITWDSALKVREELMAERTEIQQDDDDMLPYTRLFSLCEH